MIRKDPPTMVVTLKIEVAVMELLWLGSTITSFHQRKAKLPCCALHHHTSCNCVRLVVIHCQSFHLVPGEEEPQLNLKELEFQLPATIERTGAGGIPWSDLNVFVWDQTVRSDFNNLELMIPVLSMQAVWLGVLWVCVFFVFFLELESKAVFFFFSWLIFVDPLGPGAFLRL